MPANAASNTTVVTITSTQIPPQAPSVGKYRSILDVAKHLESFAAGMHPSGSVDVQVNPAQASGTLTIASGSGAVGGIINGVTITATWATSDTVAAAAVAAAINASANALVAGFVTATSALGVVTLKAPAGVLGNAITLAASGTGVTASGARLTGGTVVTGQALTF